MQTTARKPAAETFVPIELIDLFTSLRYTSIALHNNLAWAAEHESFEGCETIEAEDIEAADAILKETLGMYADDSIEFNPPVAPRHREPVPDGFEFELEPPAEMIEEFRRLFAPLAWVAIDDSPPYEPTAEDLAEAADYFAPGLRKTWPVVLPTDGPSREQRRLPRREPPWEPDRPRHEY